MQESRLIQQHSNPHLLPSQLQSNHHSNDDFYKLSVFNEFPKMELQNQMFMDIKSSRSNKTFEESTSFSASQIACICKTLYLNREGEKLNQFFESHQQARQLCDLVHYFSDSDLTHSQQDSADVFCSYIYALYYRQDYEELFERIRCCKLDQRYHKELQKLWYEAHYALDQSKKSKQLGPVDKFRTRKKHDPPSSIWDGEKIVYAFKERQRKVLQQFFSRNRYPKPHEKLEIARLTGLEMSQISNWFKNKRQRNKSPDIEHPNLLNSSPESIAFKQTASLFQTTNFEFLPR